MTLNCFGRRKMPSVEANSFTISQSRHRGENIQTNVDVILFRRLGVNLRGR